MLKSARSKERKERREKDPEGRMPLADHLRELRDRLIKAVGAILVVTIAALFFYQHIVDFLMAPVLDSVGCPDGLKVSDIGEQKQCADFTMNGLISPFSTLLKVSFMTGLVVSTPVWLYQLWAFLAPGLHRHEKKYSLWFVAAGVPLFLCGAYFAYAILPTTAEVLLDFTPDNTKNLLPIPDFLDLLTRMIVVFGLSFELPLVLVLLNLGGALSGKKMLGWWRWMIMSIVAFGAIATPSTDPIGMFALAGPVIVLYFGACGFSLVNDRRKARRAAMGPDDDEASDLDLTPEAIGEVETVAASAAPALPEQAGGDSDTADPARRGGYDDIT
ncbi:Sec-independent protein translocase protein TatC [Streptomyces sp. RB5]|uniref:Sec-independent protein translocase protein TatC n=1 Tax=Streptomyces smaragdinus TaxID=2585196 RepID=A0A7K0CKI1_9ACTN|nr:twin-arginine translocase subunit TatC [Streptomyces smaragdinus]MQY14009.1 Sec-independent protein translocase protein TatC [Streptomyces smaragdinus]